MTVIVDAAEQVNPLDNLRDPRWRGRRLLGRQQLWAGVAAAVVCWGWNDYGQADAPPLGRFTALAAGNAHNCAIRVDKTIVCWGHGPHVKTLPEGAFTVVAAGLDHSCAIRADGTITCWGVSAWPTAVSGSTSAAMGGRGSR